jgi:hypothetical protein
MCYAYMVQMEPGALGGAGTFLDVSVGPYELALLASVVLAVQYEVPYTPVVELRGRRIPLVDLFDSFALGRRTILPYVVAFEVDGRDAAVGVDRVGHLGRGEAPRPIAVPPFGLREPRLFLGAMKADQRLVLVLNPAGLFGLAAPRTT